MNELHDPLFTVKVAAQTPCPQQLIYAGMHQDYSEKFVGEETLPDEETSGAIAVKRLLAGERGHFGPLEAPQITFACGYFPHSVIQQARTHRVSVSFDVQSMRYTGDRIVDLANKLSIVDTEHEYNIEEIYNWIEDVFYLRPVGRYSDRQGKRYEYTEDERRADLAWCLSAAKRYAKKVKNGHSEEHARGILPFDYRQHFLVTFNLRSLMHFLDLRYKKDAQIEIQALCGMMLPYFSVWTPAIAEWYTSTRLGRAKLSP